MTAPDTQALGFSTEDDQSVAYIARSRTYYAAVGFTTPYRWACFAEVPFAGLSQPLAGCRIAIVTTAAPFDPAKRDQGPGAAYNDTGKFCAPYGDADGLPTAELQRLRTEFAAQKQAARCAALGPAT